MRWILGLALAWMLMASLDALAGPDGELTVAVSYFDNTSRDESLDPLRKGMAHMLITELSHLEGIRVVERERLEDLLSEIELGRTKYIDPSTAQKLGKGLGATHILTGAYLLLGDTLRLDVRLVEVQTRQVIFATSTEGQKDDVFSMQGDIVRELSTALSLKDSRGTTAHKSALKFDGLQLLSQKLDAYDQKDRKRAEGLLSASGHKSDNQGPSESDLATLEARAQALKEKSDRRASNIPAHLLNLADKLIAKDEAGCQLFMATVQASSQEMMEAMKKGHGSQLVQSQMYLVVEYLLDHDAFDGVCTATPHPTRELLGTILMSLGVTLGNPDDQQRLGLLAVYQDTKDNKGEVILKKSDLDDLFLRYASVYLEHYPDGPLTHQRMMGRGLGDWVETVLARKKLEALGPAQKAAAIKEREQAQALTAARQYFGSSFATTSLPFVILLPFPEPQGHTVSASFAYTLDHIFHGVDRLEISLDEGQTWIAWPNAATHGLDAATGGGLEVRESDRVNPFGSRSWFRSFRLVEASPTLTVRLTLMDESKVAPFTCPALPESTIGTAISTVDGMTGVDTRVSSGSTPCYPTK